MEIITTSIIILFLIYVNEYCSRLRLNGIIGLRNTVYLIVVLSDNTQDSVRSDVTNVKLERYLSDSATLSHSAPTNC